MADAPKAPEYWKFIFVKATEHELSIYSRYKGDFAFRPGDWNFAQGNADRTTARWGNSLLDFLNWSDRCNLDVAYRLSGQRETIFANPYYLENKFLPGMSQVSILPNGQAFYDQLLKDASVADEYSVFLRQYQEIWTNNPSVRPNAEVQGAECNRRISDAMTNVRTRAMEYRRAYPVPGAFPNTPYEKLYVDRANWTATDEGRALVKLREDLLNGTRKRAGFVSSAEFFDKFGQVASTIGKFSEAVIKVGLIVGTGVVAAYAAPIIASAAAPTLGVSTGTLGTAIQGGALATATGKNPLASLTPVAGEAAKNIGGSVGFLDDLNKQVSTIAAKAGGTSFTQLGESLSKFTIPQIGGVIGETLGSLTPSQVLNTVAPKQTPVSSVPATTTASVVKSAAIPAGAIIALVAIYFYAKGK